MAVDGKKAVILVLLDLSAAFDTVDHSVLFRRLKHAFGLSGEVLNWFKSYLSYRSQVVSIRDAVTEVIYLLFGVPQGSVLGPLVFVMYTRPIGLIARKHGVQFHLYADDTQLYVSLDVNYETNRKSSLDTLESCISEIRVWMTHNLLKLNDDKTDIIYIASPHFAKSISVPTIKVDDTQIEPSLKVKNLGVIFDQFLTMDDHITTVCKASYFHLKNIRSLKPYLSREALLTVTHSFITARIDYCNGLLYGITEHNINRLQRIQNCAARLITNTKKYDHITPVLYTLHWLPIRQRVQYKILLLTYKAIKGLAPAYICELISLKTSSRTLRSSDQLTLNTPVARLKSYGDSSFSVAGPMMWNKLHVGMKHAKTINNFKTLLKTHLFNTAFNSSH